MKRREALKNIGLTLGYTAIAPTALSILQSCTSDAETWTPLFFTKDETIIVKKLVDLILPKTDSNPGGLDVNVPQFLDVYAAKVYDEKGKISYRKKITSIIYELSDSKDNVDDIKDEDYIKFLDKYLKANKPQIKLFEKEKNLAYESIQTIRSQSIWAYKSSETVGETVLSYDPVPGVQKGCISLEEATNGKVWSL